ncbi:MAG: 23S rRNA (pseudouridine(1915)-N(3))-methyltransferase RlmH [Woeseiaceae bacterium]
MHIRLLAVGDRQPSWVDTAFNGYTERLPRQWQFRLEAVATADRRKAASPERAKNTEAEKLLGKLKPAEYVVLLDEKGRQFSSRELSTRVDDWQTGGEDLVFIIGGPDGVADEVRERANLTWSLSNLTLPHGLARVLFAEQLYRAWSLTTGHPYHRD